jgi:hypothetical protein
VRWLRPSVASPVKLASSTRSCNPTEHTYTGDLLARGRLHPRRLPWWLDMVEPLLRNGSRDQHRRCMALQTSSGGAQG